MSGAEIPQFDSNFDPSAVMPENLESPANKLLRDTVRDFSNMLEATRQPDVMNYAFTFLGHRLSELYLPKSIHTLIKKYGPIDEITIECSYLKDTGTTFEIQFEFCDELDSNSSYLRIQRPYNYTPNEQEQDYDFVYCADEVDDEQEEIIDSIHPLTKQELNRCLASIIEGDPETTTSALDAYNWVTGDYEHLVAGLMDTASYHSSNHEYILKDADGGPAGSYSFEEVNGKIIQEHIYRIATQNIDVSSGGNLGYYEKAIETTIEATDSGYATFFWEHVFKDDIYVSTKITPDKPDYNTLHEFIDLQVVATHTQTELQAEGNSGLD